MLKAWQTLPLVPHLLPRIRRVIADLGLQIGYETITNLRYLNLHILPHLWRRINDLQLPQQINAIKNRFSQQPHNSLARSPVALVRGTARQVHTHV